MIAVSRTAQDVNDTLSQEVTNHKHLAIASGPQVKNIWGYLFLPFPNFLIATLSRKWGVNVTVSVSVSVSRVNTNMTQMFTGTDVFSKNYMFLMFNYFVNFKN